MKHETTCDLQRVSRYLDEQLSESDHQEFEQHLSTCEFCRTELHSQAADPEVWKDAAQLLSGTIDQSPTASDCGTDPNPRSVTSVLDSLAPTDDPEMLGRIGEYEISGVVGAGGMGAVLKGFDRSLKRVVAIKVMAPHLANNGSARTRFQREARAAAAITHDNVIDTYGVSEANGLPYLVMPFARGPSLQKRIDQSGPLSTIEIVRIGRQIAAGLAAAHEQGLVHRDIKPANILLNEGIERLWITDFGVARAMDDASMTQTGVIAGTPQYMSPEQARGESVDHRSDLFSLGSVLYTASTGRVPFRAEAAYGILRQITDTDPCPIQEINPDIPKWLCRIIDRLMTKHAADRFQTADEIADLLDGCLAHLQQPTVSELPACVRTSQVVSETSAAVAKPTRIHSQASPFLTGRKIAMIASLLVCICSLAAVPLTNPVDISGQWKGEQWSAVQLATVDEATDWYNGTLTTADGRTGAIQLEWSRLQRRFNGRWKIGNNESGSLTLRMAENGRVKGAISVDADSMLADESPRLRELAWGRTHQKAIPLVSRSHATAELKAFTNDAEQQSITTVESTHNGKVLKINVKEAEKVKAGQLIATIEVTDDLKRIALERQQANSEAIVDSLKAVLRVNEAAMMEQMRELEVLLQELEHAELLETESLRIADAKLSNAKNSVKAAVAERETIQAELDHAKAVFDQKAKLKEKAMISQSEIRLAEFQMKSLEAKIATAASAIESAKNDLVVLSSNERVNASQLKSSIARSKNAVESKKAELTGVQRKLDSIIQEIATHQQANDKRMKETVTKLDRKQVDIVAAADGVIKDVRIRENQTVKIGDVLFTIEKSAVASTDLQIGSETPTDRAANSGIARTPSAIRQTNESVAVMESISKIQKLISDMTQKIDNEKKRQANYEEKAQSLELTYSDNSQSAKLLADKAVLDAYIAETQVSQERSKVELDSLKVRHDTLGQLLKTQFQEARNRTLLAERQLANIIRRHSVGDVSQDAVLAAEQEFESISSEFKQIEALMSYWQKVQEEVETANNTTQATNSGSVEENSAKGTSVK